MVKHLAWIPALTLATMMPLQSSAQARSYSDAGKAELDVFLAQAVRETYVPGLVAMVVGRDGAIYQGAFGDLRVELLPAPNATVTLRFPMGAGRDSFGLGFQIAGEHDEADMRAPGSLSWAGIHNTQFWIDPRNGIGAILPMQYWPFYDGVAMEAFVGFEERVYRYLQ